MRNAAAVAQGAKVTEPVNSAPIISICALMSKLTRNDSTAPAPKINTGMYSGKISSDIKTPPPRNPMVRAAPTAPIRLNTGVPINKVSINKPIEAGSMPSCKPNNGDNNTKGMPDNIQCAATLLITNRVSGCGRISICSKQPSW